MTTSLTKDDGTVVVVVAEVAVCGDRVDGGCWNCYHWRHYRDDGDAGDSGADSADFSRQFWVSLRRFRPAPAFRHAALTFGSSDSLHIAAGAVDVGGDRLIDFVIDHRRCDE